MKDQYFGDVNDFKKYGLLRVLTGADIRLGVYWMLTDADGSSDGRLLSYLEKPTVHRNSDPDLFDWLKQIVNSEGGRSTSSIERSGLLGTAHFQNRILTDHGPHRRAYFSEVAAQFAACDIVFFDPDNGIEVRSVRPGNKHSRKYVYWDEIVGAFGASCSVLIYQHFPRKSREAYARDLAKELKQRTGAEAVFIFRTPHVLFLLASQTRHAPGFRDKLASVHERWAAQHIRGEELAG